MVITIQEDLNKNDVGQAKAILKQYIDQLRRQIPHEKDDELQKNMLTAVNLVDENLAKIEPGNEGAAQDIEKILQSGIFGIGVYLGTIGSAAVGGVGGVTGAVSEGLGTGLERLSKGNLLTALTGTLQGALYGLAYGFINGFFEGFNLPLILLTGEPMQNALKNNDVAKAKPLLLKYIDAMKQQMPKIKDTDTRQILLKTVNLINENIKKIEPEDKGAMNDIKKTVEALLLFAKFGVGFGLGGALGNVGGLIGGVGEGLDTGLKRLGKGQILGTVTGTVAGTIHGLVKGLIDNFGKSFAAPLKT